MRSLSCTAGISRFSNFYDRLCGPWLNQVHLPDMLKNQTPAGSRGPGGLGFGFLDHAARRTSSAVIPGSHAMHAFLNWHHEHCIPGCGW